MKWEWLRVDHRIEWTLSGVVLLGALLFGLISVSSHDMFMEILLPLLGGLFSLTIIVPVYVYLVIQRRRAAAGTVPKRRSLTRAGRLTVYLLLLLVTLASAQVQVAHGFADYVGSVPAVYFWNLTLLGAVIAWEELFRQRRKRTPPPLDQSE